MCLPLSLSPSPPLPLSSSLLAAAAATVAAFPYPFVIRHPRGRCHCPHFLCRHCPRCRRSPSSLSLALVALTLIVAMAIAIATLFFILNDITHKTPSSPLPSPLPSSPYSPHPSSAVRSR